MKKTYCVTGYSNRIEVYEVVEETQHYVTFRMPSSHGDRQSSFTRREKKEDRHFPSWELARQHLINRANKRVLQRYGALEDARKDSAACDSIPKTEP